MKPIQITKAEDHADNADQKAHRSMSVPVDLKAVRARLEQDGGPQVWRSLEAVAAFREKREPVFTGR